jgi:hypothetical protein
MVHGILQFTPSIAFRYVLHRCESQDIRCRESLRLVKQNKHTQLEQKLKCAVHTLLIP